MGESTWYRLRRDTAIVSAIASSNDSYKRRRLMSRNRCTFLLFRPLLLIGSPRPSLTINETEGASKQKRAANVGGDSNANRRFPPIFPLLGHPLPWKCHRRLDLRPGTGLGGVIYLGSYISVVKLFRNLSLQ